MTSLDDEVGSFFLLYLSNCCSVFASLSCISILCIYITVQDSLHACMVGMAICIHIGLAWRNLDRLRRESYLASRYFHHRAWLSYFHRRSNMLGPVFSS